MIRHGMFQVAFAACLLGVSTGAAQTTALRPPSVPGMIKEWVMVVDGNGQPVTDLTREDFRVLEKKAELPVAFFARGQAGPIVWALLSDNSASQSEARKLEDWSAVVPFFVRVMRPQDRLFVVDFADQYWLDCDPTADARQAQSAITKYIEGRKPYGGTALYDTIEAASRFRGTDLAGQRVLIVITDGDDNASQHTEQQASDAAVQAGATVFFVVPPQLASPASRAAFFGTTSQRGVKVARELTQTTGGDALFFSNREQFRLAFGQIGDLVADAYTIGFTPASPPKKGRATSIKIECLRAGARVVSPERHLLQTQAVTP